MKSYNANKTLKQYLLQLSDTDFKEILSFLSTVSRYLSIHSRFSQFFVLCSLKLPTNIRYTNVNMKRGDVYEKDYPICGHDLGE